YEIVKRLKEHHQRELLDKLSAVVTRTESNRGKLHQVFERSFDCKECCSEAFTQQKLTYMHENPCKGKWDLAPSPGEYRYSSAGYYFSGQQGKYEITPYIELLDIDLSK